MFNAPVSKFSSGSSELVVNGELEVKGTQGNKVYFTSINDDWIGGDASGNGTTTPAAGNWRHIKLAASTASTTFSHAIIRYGGCGATCGDGYSAANVYNNRGILNLSNASSTDAISYGIRSISRSL
jgi:hypothetical protein